MSLYQELGLRDRRRKRRVWSGVFKALFYLGIIGVLAYYSYQLGWAKAQKEIEQLQARIEGLDEENERLRIEAEQAVTARVAAEDRATAFQRQYEEEVPQGPEKEIMAAARDRLAAGVNPQRLAFVVSVAENTEECRAEPVNKRFIVQTPLTTGSNSSIGFNDGQITVSGTGSSARTAAGAPEARFDPTEPVRIAITAIGGEDTVVEGILPLQQSVVMGDTVHHFSIAEGNSPGFVMVTERQCAYP